MLFFVFRLSHYCQFKVEYVFSSQSFSQPSFDHHHAHTDRYVLSCADITYFISVLVALGLRFIAASKKENNTEGISIHFFIKCFL